VRPVLQAVHLRPLLPRGLAASRAGNLDVAARMQSLPTSVDCREGQRLGRSTAVQLQIRHADGTFTQHHEAAWPLPRTRSTKWLPDTAAGALASEPPESAAGVSFEAPGDGVTCSTTAFERQVEITGPLATRLSLQSTTNDADLFLVLCAFRTAAATRISCCLSSPSTAGLDLDHGVMGGYGCGHDTAP
jgi:hypothetical protein